MSRVWCVLSDLPVKQRSMDADATLDRDIEAMTYMALQNRLRGDTACKCDTPFDVRCPEDAFLGGRLRVLCFGES